MPTPQRPDAPTHHKAANELKNFGAERVFAFATHGLFNGPAAKRIQDCALEEVVVANTVPLRDEVKAQTSKIRVISVGKLLDGAIRAIHTGALRGGGAVRWWWCGARE